MLLHEEQEDTNAVVEQFKQVKWHRGQNKFELSSNHPGLHRHRLAESVMARLFIVVVLQLVQANAPAVLQLKQL